MRTPEQIAPKLVECVESVGILHILDELDWNDIVDLYVEACKMLGRDHRRVQKEDVPRNYLSRQLREDLMMLDLLEEDDPERNGLLDEDDERLVDL